MTLPTLLYVYSMFYLLYFYIQWQFYSSDLCTERQLCLLYFYSQKNSTFSICLDVMRWSLLLALTTSLYDKSDLLFFSKAPDSRSHIWALREWGMPCLTIPRSFSDLGSLTSTYQQECDKNLHVKRTKVYEHLCPWKHNLTYSSCTQAPAIFFWEKL